MSDSKSLAEDSSPPRLISANHRWTDFDHMAQSMTGWNLNLRQISPGPFEGRVSLAQFEGIQVLRLAVNRMVLAQGSPPPKSVVLSPVTPTTSASVFRGQRLRPGQLSVVASGDDIHHVTASEYDNIVVTVDEAVLQKATSVLYGIDLGRTLLGKVSIQPNVQECLRSSRLIQRALACLTVEPPTCLHATKSLMMTCVERLAKLFRFVDRSPNNRRIANPKRLTDRAESLMEASLHQPLTTTDLCRELDVSERTLRYAFQEVRGIRPMTFYKAIRLNAVRREIKSAEDGSSIAEVAGRWGFWHTGEFAADYRKLFGELPSFTKQRRANSKIIA